MLGNLRFCTRLCEQVESHEDHGAYSRQGHSVIETTIPVHRQDALAQKYCSPLHPYSCAYGAGAAAGGASIAIFASVELLPRNAETPAKTR
jgi:hypothetical protein